MIYCILVQHSYTENIFFLHIFTYSHPVLIAASSLIYLARHIYTRVYFTVSQMMKELGESKDRPFAL